MKNTYSFRLSDELITALDRAAADQNRTRGNLVETILLSAMEEKMNTYLINGKLVELLQDPYLDGTNDDPYYRASGRLADGTEVEVHWQILPGFDGDDESNACDWDKGYIA